ncbi:hypothetical protein [Nocardioides houyundeii]|uniref:hypothetical protein n=1 Tax=Nocardioides houyundeii TaxID=2045452 RepID=UPI000C77DCEC|nr:hypothetical protein [Nocardioides houyundeii]
MARSPFHSRRWQLALCGLALLLAAAPFVPRDDEPAATAATSAAAPSASAQADWRTHGRITPAMRVEIDRVVQAGALTGRRSAAAEAARCAVFAGERYCLGLGWTTASPAEVGDRLAYAAQDAGRHARQAAGGRVERTGDLDAAGLLERRRRMTPTERAAADRRELEAAARAVDKVRLLRAEVQGRPLPDGTLGRPKKAREHARRASILTSRRSREQNQVYWCGPATAQSIAWGWRKRRQDQRVWAKRLGTTRAGTAITDLVRVVNNNTGYDRNAYADDYVVLDIDDFTFRQWFRLMMRHIEDYRAPVVLHPVLEKRFYPYLDDDASGHFQVGRGFQRTGDGDPQLGYFEPWNQQRFDPSEPFIARNQWHSAYQQYRANRAHFQHNVGV